MADITGTTVEHSRGCLIRAIHGVDSIPKDLLAHPLSYHIEVNPRKYVRYLCCPLI